MIYLDNAATTAMSEGALKKLLEVSQETFGNPSSLHSFGRKASYILREARQSIANALDTKPERLIFTSGGTESNNLALIGYALTHQDKGNHLITTAIEHHAVLHPMEELAKSHGFELTIIEPKDGHIAAQQIKEALRPDTLLVSVMHTNNETGDLLPIAEIGALLKDHQAVFHVDAVQAVGKVPIFPEKDGIDLLSASAHKFHGPKGVGFLYTGGLKLKPLLLGGDQESKRRASTENIASIAAMATALEESLEDSKTHFTNIHKLRQQLLDQLSGYHYYINGSQKQSPYVLSLGLPNQLNERLLMQLDLAGIAVSSGSACTAGNIEPSHVLKALYGSDSKRLKETIRISFSKDTTSDDITALTTTLKSLIGE